MQRTLYWGLYWLACMLIAIGLWLQLVFGRPALEQIIYHLQFGMQGLRGVDSELVVSFAWWCFAVPSLVSVVLILISKRLTNKINTIICLLLSVIALVYFLYRIALFEHLVNNSKEDYIAKYYVEPDQIKLIKAPKNLVLLYVESLEKAYTDPKFSGENLLATLDKFPGVSFDLYRQTRGTGWTIAALVSTMCGIPLKPKLDAGRVLQSNELGQKVDDFLPNLTCLGDILHDNGYKNVYMGGADLSFGGKGKFFRAHGYDEVLGLYELAADQQIPRLHWGLYDDQLFGFLKQKVDELEDSNQPYNLTALTLDTHHPKGFISNYCRAKGVQDFKGIVKCTGELVHDFIVYMQDKGYLKHTQVIILGDHLAITTDMLQENLREYTPRTIYNKFITNDALNKNREEIVHFDMFPTILTSLGFEVPNQKMGLGISGFGELTIALNPQRFNYMHENIMGASKKYVEFWQTNINTKIN